MLSIREGQSSVLGAAATSSKADEQAKKSKPSKNRHKLPRGNVLLELRATKIQILKPLFQNMPSKYIVCARKKLTLRILRALNSSSNRSRFCQDVSSIARSNSSHGPSGNVFISVSFQDCLQASVKNLSAVRKC